MIQLLNQKKVSAFGRDNIMELIIKYVSRSEGVGWSDKMACNEGKASVVGHLLALILLR